ncbi:MAG TPA: hypothetical protein VMI13_08680 [Solirubrobacteraceae bacterium]|nr:hypothetical protein [Solirubrobacteraceae bacterium]
MCAIAVSGVASAETNLKLLEAEGGAEVMALGKNLVETIKLEQTSCVFTMPSGNLKANNEESLEVRFPTFSEEHCEGGSTRTRFYKAVIGPFGSVMISTEATESHAKVRYEGCLYNISSMSGPLALGHEVKTTVEGEGTAKAEPGCTGLKHTFTGELTLSMAEGAKSITYLTS